MIAWMNIVVSPVMYLYQQFKLFRKNKLYELSITSQVCRLEALLNDRYDFTNRGIFIDEGLERPPLYLYQDAETHPVHLYQDSEISPVLLYTDGEGGLYSDDFIVMVPVSVSFNQIEMRALINRYKLPGMRYSIQTY